MIRRDRTSLFAMPAAMAILALVGLIYIATRDPQVPGPAIQAAAYLTAYSENDHAQLCSLLDPEYRRQIELAATCPQAMESVQQAARASRPGSLVALINPSWKPGAVEIIARTDTSATARVSDQIPFVLTPAERRTIQQEIAAGAPQNIPRLTRILADREAGHGCLQLTRTSQDDPWKISTITPCP